MATKTVRQTPAHQGYVVGWRQDQRLGQKDGVEHPQRSALRLLAKMMHQQQRHQQQEPQHRLRCAGLHVHLRGMFLGLHQALNRQECPTETLQFKRRMQMKHGVDLWKTPVMSQVDEQGWRPRSEYHELPESMPRPKTRRVPASGRRLTSGAR